MKIYLLLFFLIIFVFADEEIDVTDNTLEMDIQTCAETDYENCGNAPILTPGHICCKIEETTHDDDVQTCELKTTREDQDRLVGSSFIINKELGGLSLYNEKYGGVPGNITEREQQIYREISIDCGSWNFYVSILNKEDYTSKDIQILQSDNHCLSYFNPILIHTSANRRYVDRKTCFKASLLDSTKAAGISCGYMEITIIEQPTVIETRKTCFLYDPKVAETGILDEASKGNLNTLTRKNEDGFKYNFTIYAENKEGYIYDSETGIVSKTRDTNGCRMNKVLILNYMLLIILLNL